MAWLCLFVLGNSRVLLGEPHGLNHSYPVALHTGAKKRGGVSPCMVDISTSISLISIVFLSLIPTACSARVRRRGGYSCARDVPPRLRFPPSLVMATEDYVYGSVRDLDFEFQWDPVRAKVFRNDNGTSGFARVTSCAGGAAAAVAVGFRIGHVFRMHHCKHNPCRAAHLPSGLYREFGPPLHVQPSAWRPPWRRVRPISMPFLSPAMTVSAPGLTPAL